MRLRGSDLIDAEEGSQLNKVTRMVAKIGWAEGKCSNCGKTLRRKKPSDSQLGKTKADERRAGFEGDRRILGNKIARGREMTQRTQRKG